MKNIRHVVSFCLAAVLATPALGETEKSTAETTPLSEAFAGVLRSGNAQKLQEALRAGAPVNATDRGGETPLIYAALYGNVECMRLLLDGGARINEADASGGTALMRSSFDREKVALLLARGAEVNQRSALGNTALILAARPWNSHETVALLLDRGAQVDATNNWGATALMAAAAGGDVATVKMLLARGAKPNAEPARSHEGFIFGGGRTPLMWAAFRGDLAVIKLLLDAGANVNLPTGMGTPLTQASWGDHAEAARVLIAQGAQVNQPGPQDGFTPLHWAASSEEGNRTLLDLLLSKGADPNAGGGADVDAFLGTLQTPLMLLARQRGPTAGRPLLRAGATNAGAKAAQAVAKKGGQREGNTVPAAINRAIPPLQETSLASKKAFVRHASRQDCTSCHQQYLPMAAIGMAKKQHATVDREAEQQLIAMVGQGELKNLAIDLEPVFHPDAVHTKGYTILGYAAEELPPSPGTDAWVHHLSAIQGKDGQWHNNLPRPPIQTSDIGATALAIHALQRYPLPGRKEALAAQVDRARSWLWNAKTHNTEERIYQILGLSWAGEPASKLQALARDLVAEQRADGGWAQLPALNTDAYATAQAIYTLRVAGQYEAADAVIKRGVEYLLNNQLADGTWHVRRRAFPFQPTMDSGFPHGRDSWISAAASSWAVMALSQVPGTESVAMSR
ncbi:MAG: ankyrin repeat domain-containing protein [Verrucomicrobiota bacterium]